MEIEILFPPFLPVHNVFSFLCPTDFPNLEFLPSLFPGHRKKSRKNFLVYRSRILSSLLFVLGRLPLFSEDFFKLFFFFEQWAAFSPNFFPLDLPKMMNQCP